MRITQRISKCKECSTMNKKVLIISSSPRKGGNSETLAAAFAKGARKAGHQVETVYLREKQVGFCKGCLACLKLGHCVIQDDAVEIAAKMHDANVLVFATPDGPPPVRPWQTLPPAFRNCHPYGDLRKGSAPFYSS